MGRHGVGDERFALERQLCLGIDEVVHVESGLDVVLPAWLVSVHQLDADSLGQHVDYCPLSQLADLVLAQAGLVGDRLHGLIGHRPARRQ